MHVIFCRTIGSATKFLSFWIIFFHRNIFLLFKLIYKLNWSKTQKIDFGRKILLKLAETLLLAHYFAVQKMYVKNTSIDGKLCVIWLKYITVHNMRAFCMFVCWNIPIKVCSDMFCLNIKIRFVCSIHWLIK